MKELGARGRVIIIFALKRLASRALESHKSHKSHRSYPGDPPPVHLFEDENDDQDDYETQKKNGQTCLHLAVRTFCGRLVRMNGRTGFPALHLAPGHTNSDLDVALLETPTPLSSAIAKRVSRLGQQ
jgi:hypothetical protein